ncbi:hypothetical protein ACFRMQ_33845 [Kitasatospora sp. NPDC056783]|uniref:hypothetical protein n=1 Tax=Kitasatospora sp. NPDC056783 TaxID=3345943 RepID=UPI0036BE234C
MQEASDDIAAGRENDMPPGTVTFGLAPGFAKPADRFRVVPALRPPRTSLGPAALGAEDDPALYQRHPAVQAVDIALGAAAGEAGAMVEATDAVVTGPAQPHGSAHRRGIQDWPRPHRTLTGRTRPCHREKSSTPVGSSFYVSADREQAGPWAFTGEQVRECVRRHWPHATVSGSSEGFLEIMANVEPGRPAEVSFNLRHGVFSFVDRGSPAGPLSVVYRVLHDLAPDVPVVWWIDYDVDLRLLDLVGGLDAFLASFPL